MTFEQAREQITERLFNEKRRAEFDKYLEKLRAEAIIEWKNAECKKAYDAGSSRSRPAGRRPARVPDPSDPALEESAPSRAGAGSTEWFAIWTRSRHEQVVREQLERKTDRRVPSHDHAVEPLEGPEEKDRLAAVSRLLLRALRSVQYASRSSSAPAS